MCEQTPEEQTSFTVAEIRDFLRELVAAGEDGMDLERGTDDTWEKAQGLANLGWGNVTEYGERHDDNMDNPDPPEPLYAIYPTEAGRAALAALEAAETRVPEAKGGEPDVAVAETRPASLAASEKPACPHGHDAGHVTYNGSHEGCDDWYCCRCGTHIWIGRAEDAQEGDAADAAPVE